MLYHYQKSSSFALDKILTGAEKAPWVGYLSKLTKYLVSLYGRSTFPCWLYCRRLLT